MCIGDFIFVTLNYLHACQQHKSQKPYVNLTQKIGLQCVHLSGAGLCLAYSLIIKQVKHYFVSEVRCFNNIVRAFSIFFLNFKN